MRNGIDAYAYASLAKTSASAQKTCRCTSARMDASTDIFSSRLATSGITRQGLIHWSARCVVQREKQEKKDQERAKQIRKALQEKGAWKCTCRCPIHAPKCQLYPSYAGERHWQGKSKGLSEEDLQFIAERIRK